MSRKPKYDWPALFAAYEHSELTQTHFCRQHNVNPKYFSLKLSKYKTQASGVFTRAVVQSVAEHDASPAHCITLDLGYCKIHWPMTLPVPSLASLIRSLA